MARATFARESSLPDAFDPVIAQLDPICQVLGRDPASRAGVPIAGSPEEIAGTLGTFADMGVTRIELMMWQNTPASLEAVAPVLWLLDGSA